VRISKIVTFVISLEEGRDRRERLLRDLKSISNCEVHIVNAVRGTDLPFVARQLLAQDAGWAARKGTIGCFLSHLIAWEGVADISEPYGVILEDDANASNLGAIIDYELPSDADIVFINERMAPLLEIETSIEPAIYPILQTLRRFEMNDLDMGADGYLLSPSAARKLIAACATDSLFGHVDGRLLRYCTSPDDLAQLAPDSRVATVIKNHHHRLLAPQLGLIRGFAAAPPLISHRGVASTRAEYDGDKKS